MLTERIKQLLRPAVFPLRLAYPGRRVHPWLADYLQHHRSFDRARFGPDQEIDIMVLVVDHFEPGDRDGPVAAAESVSDWCANYREIAANHRDADGRMPQHTWFYRAEYPNYECIRVLSEYCYHGCGEIEFHLHHGFDTHASFCDKLAAGVAFFNQVGAMLSLEPVPKKRFGYIAGNWALDNGVGDDTKSGCNTELRALRDAGCYADFTFPALGSKAQPQTINSIYYATDTPGPKSYNTGRDVAVGAEPVGDLMLIQGPLSLVWSKGCIDDGAIESYRPPSPSRLHTWLKANVHVQGRPNWIFVKLHCHGMQSKDVWQGRALNETIAAMCKEWNTHPFRLHFVTAREAYNIVKAAELGKDGDPNEYRDFIIPPPANTRIYCDKPWHLQAFSPERVALRSLDSKECLSATFHGLPIESVAGRIDTMDISLRDDRADVRVTGDGPIEVVESGIRRSIQTSRNGRYDYARD
jgi:hypothetical protein